MKINNFKIVSILLSAILMTGAACKNINSKSNNEIIDSFETNVLPVHPDVFDVKQQIKVQWPVMGDEIIVKALGHTDTKALVDPALLAAVLEAEQTPDSNLSVPQLYEKTNALRQLISNPGYAQNLFYILSQYFIEKYDRKYLFWVSQWQASKNYNPNLFLRISDALPYIDKSMYGQTKNLGFVAEAYVPENTTVYSFVKKVIARYKKYRERPDHFQGYEWIKQKFINDFLNPYQFSPARRAALELRASSAAPEGIYADLYRKLVLLGAIPYDQKPTQKNLLRSILNSDYLNQDLTAFKTTLNDGNLSAVLSVEKATELIARCNEALERWKKNQDFFEQLMEMIGDSSGKILRTAADRDDFMSSFTKKFNDKAVLLSKPLMHAQLGLPEKYVLDERFYEIFQQKFEKYFHNAPLKGVITSPFVATRYNEKVGKTYPHGATDLGADHGTPIRTIWGGNAKVIKNHPSMGNLLILETQQPDGKIKKVKYAHCSKIFVDNNSYVVPGEIIALVGSTGYSSGPHLHIGIEINGVPWPYDKQLVDSMKMTPFDILVSFLSDTPPEIPPEKPNEKTADKTNKKTPLKN